MTETLRSSSLFRILVADALTCAAMGLLLVAAPGLVGGLTAIPATLLFWAGVSLIPVAAFIALVALRWMHQFPAAIGLVIAGNVAWVLASLTLLGLIAANALGVAFIVGQAAVVLVLTWLEATALRAAARGDHGHQRLFREAGRAS